MFGRGPSGWALAHILVIIIIIKDIYRAQDHPGATNGAFLAILLCPVFSASRVQHISDLYLNSH